jgi:leucyl aminopeptidase (aminopeptidase T)
VVAAQRVAMLHPDAARASIAKAKDEVADFIERVSAYQAEQACTRTVAMSEIRKRNPEAFDRLQNV